MMCRNGSLIPGMIDADKIMGALDVGRERRFLFTFSAASTFRERFRKR